jgi:hypothetical protein
VTAALLAGVAGLALLDALNPATIAGVALLLLAPIAHPVRAAAGFVAGAYLTVLGLGAVVYVGADTAADAAGNGLVWVRRVAFTVAAVALAVAGLRRLRARIRPAVTVPDWINPLTAAVLGLFMTGADLPNAFPYFIAIERIVNADVGTTHPCTVDPCRLCTGLLPAVPAAAHRRHHPRRSGTPPPQRPLRTPRRRKEAAT